ncbi:MAG: hypothetical protein ICV62_07215 [Cyanobacteria bacterium Co-bin13]|nr:hypothetical protein [Cyanobacteria bacterium Co-bin13]
MQLHHRRNPQSNSWNASRLAHHGRQLETAYGLGLNQPSAEDSADSWTEQSPINLGRSLASAHLLGL